jgi:hypothetical protein
MQRTVILIVLGISCGCAPKEPRPLEPVDVTSEMRQMVMSRYQPLVRSQLTTPGSAQFTEVPEISAHRDPGTRRTELSAVGEVHAHNEEGAMARYRYHLVWEEGFGGWRLRQKSVAPAEE